MERERYSNVLFLSSLANNIDYTTRTLRHYVEFFTILSQKCHDFLKGCLKQSIEPLSLFPLKN